MIRRILIQNFKSLRNVTVELAEITVLIGRSGSGKTNFLEAIRCLRTLLKKGLPGIQNSWQNLGSIDASQSDNIVFEIEFDFPNTSDQFIYRLAIPVGNFRKITEERLTLKGRVLFQQSQNIWVDPQDQINRHLAGQIALSSIAGIQEAAVASEIISNGLACYDFPGNVLQQTQSGQLALLADNGENFISSLAAIENDIRHLNHWKQILAALQRLNTSVKTLLVPRPNPEKIEVVHQLGPSSLKFNLSQESEGFRRFLAHLIALYQVPDRAVLAFDEPEKGIYPGALGILAEEFNNAPSEGRGQIILTTHSPQLLDHFDPKGIRVVEMRDNSTSIGPLAGDQYESVRSRLMSTGELLTTDPARISTPAA